MKKGLINKVCINKILFLQTCSPECDGGLDSQKLLLCQDFLFEDKNPISLSPGPRQKQEQVAVGAMLADDKYATSPDNQVAKRYGGFMKRYGGFMSRRSSSPEWALKDPGNQNNEDNFRLEILKILNSVTEHGSEGDGQGKEGVRKYGGFEQKAEDGVMQGDLLEAVLGRGLKKRYGGFMRRVGRPEWLVDSSKGGRVLKRAWENGSELQKRYGGFMD